MKFESQYYGICALGDSVTHHGIKGQKWGIRRYQNEDGTLTDKGRKRYARTAQRELNRLNQEASQAVYDQHYYKERAAKYDRAALKATQRGNARKFAKATNKSELAQKKRSEIEKRIQTLMDKQHKKVTDLSKSGYDVSMNNSRVRFVKPADRGTAKALARAVGLTLGGVVTSRSVLGTEFRVKKGDHKRKGVITYV